VDYKARYQRVAEHARIALDRRWRFLPALSFPFLSFLLARQSAYLLWVVATVLIQVVEVLLLASAHYVYFPSESLTFLRVLSTVSLLGVVGALAIRLSLHDARREKTEESFNGPDSRFRALARTVFAFALTISAVLILILLLGTKLHVSSPSIFRAMLVGGILVLPFDIVSGFLLYNLRTLGAPPFSNRLRGILFLALLLSLVPLYYGNALLYLVLRILPHVWVTKYVWKLCFRQPFLNLFIVHRATADEQLFLRGVLHRLSGGFLFVVVSEAAFYAIFYKISRYDSNAALLVFFLHKLIHLGSVLGTKTALMFATDLHRRVGIGPLRWFYAARRKLLTAGCLYGLCSAAILPALLVRQEVLMWLSPVGTLITFSWSTALVLGASVLAASVMYALSQAHTNSKNGQRTSLSFGLWACVPAAAVFFSFTALSRHLSASELLVVSAGVYLCCCVLAASSLYRRVRRDFSTHATADSTLIGLLHGARSEGVFGYVEFWDEVPDSFLRVYPDLKEFRWSRTGVFLCSAGRNDCEGEVRKILREFGHSIRVARFAPTAGKDLRKTCASVLPGSNAVDAKLFEIAARGESSARFKIPTNTRQPSMVSVCRTSSKGRCTSLPHGWGFCFSIEQLGWEEIAAEHPNVALECEAYLAQLAVEGSFSPAFQNRQDCRGMFHLNNRARPQTLVYFFPERRGTLYAERFEAFCVNFQDLMECFDASDGAIPTSSEAA
jgi:general stress protein CsbA